MRPLWLAPTLGTLAFGCGSEGNIRAEPPIFQEGVIVPVESVRQTDRIAQTAIPVVDVLFVVDNSCSMDVEQAALAANFPFFLSWFLDSGLDYHIGVVSTDMKDPTQAGRLQSAAGVRFVDQDTPSPDAVFAEMVSLGVSGDFEEKGRAAAYTAIEILGQTENQGFVREDSGLHLTVVSDEDDASGDSPITRAEFIDYLQGLRFGSKVSFSSIVGPTTGCPDIGEPGSDYLAVTNQVGGVFWPICQPEWTVVLDELGFLAVGLQREFFLSQLPVPGTIDVTVETSGAVLGYLEGTDWVYDRGRNSVVFLDLVPEPLAVVTLEYEVLAARAVTAGEESGL